MAVVNIVDVSSRDLSEEQLWGRNIEIPESGSKSEIYAIDLRGWALGKSSLVVAVEVVSEGVVLQRVPINHRRPDIAEAFPEVVGAENSGFRAMVSILGLAPNFELIVRAVLENNSRAPIGKIRGRRRTLRSRFQPDLQPLMLITLGRAGSTWLMCILGQHPRIVAHRPFTYETRVSSYWMHILKALSEPASYLQPIVGFDKVSVNWWLGTELSSGVLKRPHQPEIQPEIQQWLGHDGVDALVAFSQERIDAFYKQVGRLQGQTEPTYFAEKHLPDIRIPDMIREVYPRAQEIILVRDFRDMVASILAYNAKRGYTAFGREHVDNDEEYIYRLRPSALRLLESWRQRSDKAYLLRYEDLIWHPVETLSALLEYLELDAAPLTVKGMIHRAFEEVPGQEQHRTSPDADSSIGRWRSDLDPSLQAVCQQAFGDILEEFGYE